MITKEHGFTVGIVGMTILVFSGITNTINQDISFASLVIGSSAIVITMGIFGHIAFKPQHDIIKDTT
jgi:hypothetical protein